MKLKEQMIAVTGAAGFIGTHLIEALKEKQAYVVAIDNRDLPQNIMLDNCDYVKPVKCDIRDKKAIGEILKEIDVVYHLAAVANPRICRKDFDLAFEVNVIGTKNVLDASVYAKRFIFTSSAMVYGDPRYLPIDENHPLLGADQYSSTKIIGEKLCLNYYRNHGLPVTILRNFNIYGPGQETAYIIPQLIWQGLNEERIELWNPRRVRDFTYCSDAIDAIIKIGESDDTIGEILNVGSGKGIRTGELAEMVAEILKVKVVNLNKPTVGSLALICNNEKLMKLIKWNTRVGLIAGIKKVLEFFEKMRAQNISDGGKLNGHQ